MLGFYIFEKVNFLWIKLFEIFFVWDEDLYFKFYIILCYFDSLYCCDDVVKSIVIVVLFGIKLFEICVMGIDFWSVGILVLRLDEFFYILELIRNLKSKWFGVKVFLYFYIIVVRKFRVEYFRKLDESELEFRIFLFCYYVIILR